MAPNSTGDHAVHALRFEHGVLRNSHDPLTVELPLQIKINGQPFSVTMRTPGADQSLVKGLLFTEGIALADNGACILHEERDPTTGTVLAVNVEIPPMYLCENVYAKRSLLASAACGLCGQRELDAAGFDTRPLAPAGKLQLTRVESLIASMRAQQQTFAATGSTHAAALFRLEGGTPLCVFEDIGRHNAVDKAVGFLLEQQRLGEAQVLTVSGRISFEIVSKSYKAGIPFLLAVSAPSSFAVDMGQRWGMTVIGYCRDQRCTVYCNPDNVTV